MEEEKKNVPEQEGESNAAKRLRMMGFNPDEEKKADESIQVKRGIGDFWYHNKTIVLVVAFLAVIVAIGLYQSLSKITPDLYVMYSGPVYIDNQTAEQMTQAFTEIAKDYNDDGEISINFMQTLIFSEEQKEEYNDLSKGKVVDNGFNADEKLKFENELSAGETVVYLLDPSQYEEIKDSGILMSIKEALGYEPVGLNDEYSVVFSETEFSKYYYCFSVLPEDTLLVIRRATVMTAFKGEEAASAQKSHMDFFKNIMKFENPGE